MNKLLSVRGIEDAFEHWNFFQEGLVNSFKNMLAGFGVGATESFRLNGCAVTVNADTPTAGQTEYVVTAGNICLDGEPLPVEAHSIIVDAGEEAYWGVAITYSDITPAEIYGGGQANIQEVRKGVLIKSSTPPVSRMKPLAPFLSTKIRNMVYLPGLVQFFDPRPLGKTLADYFDMVSGEGHEDKEFFGWILTAVHVDWKAFYAGRTLVNIDLTDIGGASPLNAVGNIGGEKKHALTVGELPAHEFLIANAGSGGTATNRIGTGLGEYILGLGEGHNNMQPYVVGAYIMRIA